MSNAAGTGQWAEGDMFAGVQSYHYWSSTSRGNGSPRAWSVNLVNGPVVYYDKHFTYYVWPVRGGM